MNKHDRQSFLGAKSEGMLLRAKIGIVGLGGGGSHVVQQLAHIGVGNFVVIDPDIIEDTNLNRLVGGTLLDVKSKASKIGIAVRVIQGVVYNANIAAYAQPWQEVADALKGCDVIIGGLDSVTAKDELDRFCRRFLIPYIDMGMDVHEVGGRYLIAGQVVLVTPGSPCLRCMGIVTEEALNGEGRNYGAAGGKPQVVWPNGLLASAAVGLFTQLICPWHAKVQAGVYLEYDGNKHTLVPNKGYPILQTQPCPHHYPNEAGDAMFDIRRPPPVESEISQRESTLGRWLKSLQRRLGWFKRPPVAATSPQ